MLDRDMNVKIRILKHIIAGNGGHPREYRAGDIVLAPGAEAMEWCLKRWAIPVSVSVSPRGPAPRRMAAGAAPVKPSHSLRRLAAGQDLAMKPRPGLGPLPASTA
jgi:hypothetical protein